MNDNAPPVFDRESWDASCAKTAEYMGRVFAEHHKRRSGVRVEYIEPGRPVELTQEEAVELMIADGVMLTSTDIDGKVRYFDPHDYLRPSDYWDRRRALKEKRMDIE